MKNTKPKTGDPDVSAAVKRARQINDAIEEKRVRQTRLFICFACCSCGMQGMVVLGQPLDDEAEFDEEFDEVRAVFALLF